MNRFLQICLFFIFFVSGQLIAQQQQVFHSKYLNRPDTVWTFTPATYSEASQQEYPLLYLLHGWGGNFRHWDLMIDCQEYADRYGFVIVCPDGLYDSWYINSPVQGENQFEDFFFKDLFPFVIDHYRVDADEVFISGLSMGGHGALYLMAKHPEKFTSAGSLSGLLKFQAWQNHYALERVLGLDERKYHRRFCISKVFGDGQD
ncbi:MAG: alpha/beta hydrolase-fold protein [Bacteroidota bacterium]|nr:alpha/beta hydrolase-fold protein [Bacteroidota bacterium]